MLGWCTHDDRSNGGRRGWHTTLECRRSGYRQPTSLRPIHWRHGWPCLTALCAIDGSPIRGVFVHAGGAAGRVSRWGYDQ
jgi:hypothetical protein